MAIRSAGGMVGDARTACVAAVGLSLVVATSAGGQCSNDVGNGNQAEGEICPPDQYVDATNGGCDSSPAVFTNLSTGNITICGVFGTYDQDRSCDTDADCPDDNCVGDPNPGDGTAEGTCVGPSEPSQDRRDVDWYRLTPAALNAADIDGNGVVQITSTVQAEFDAVTFFVAINDVAGACNASVLAGDIGCWDQTGGTGADPASATIVIADHPEGIVAIVATGKCSGASIVDGNECVLGANDYLVAFTTQDVFPACGDPAQNPDLGPCNEPNDGVMGCADPACCDLVCTEFSALCCISGLGWIETCAEAAMDFGCAPQAGGSICIATGFDPAVDGYLRVCTDPYGAWADPGFGGQGDAYNPAGPLQITTSAPTFGSAFFLYNSALNQREMLANNPIWVQEIQGDDASLVSAILCTSPSANCVPGSDASDADNDGIDDTLHSVFLVTGTGVNLHFDLVQEIAAITTDGGDPAAVLTQTYVITNNSGAAYSFVLLRQSDFDLTWSGSVNNDVVGTDTNGAPVDRFVYQGEPGLPQASITHSAAMGDGYVGVKGNFDPDGGGPCPGMGAGTDSLEWDNYGIPCAWENVIPTAGGPLYNLNGNSGSLGGDAHIDLEIPVTIPNALGPGNPATVIFRTTYGAITPLGQALGQPCPWDCGNANGQVDTADFLTLLGQWALVGASCDFDGGGVATSDFLLLLGNWGPCP